MGKSLVYKILEKHLVSGELKPGNEIGIKIDQTLTQDATGTMAYLEFEALNKDRVETELSVSYVDHNTLQDGFENMDDHLYLMSIAKKFGIKYSKAGNGICHQVHLERFGVPGKTLLGSDSHTPTNGGIGMIAIGAGGLDVALAMAGQPFYLTAPNVIKINLTGELQPFVSAKDVILKVLEILTTKGNVGCIVEYGGPGVKSLTVPERATITNMGAELGVTTSVFPSDELTKEFLRAQGRVDSWQEMVSDNDAEYHKVIDIDLSTLVPMVACPHSPDNVKTVKELAGLSVDQVMIGSCTNASFRDLMIVSGMLDGKKVKPEVSFGVAAGSRQVLEMVTEHCGLMNIIKSGARILESVCGFCIGAGQAPKSKGVSIRTSNRNFKGRSGTAEADIYLVSPETAVACALTGEMTDPRDLGADYPKVELPKDFLIDDSMILEPAENGKDIEIKRGPNIGQPPYSDPLVEDIKGVCTLKVGDKITTDHIMPAGSRLKYRSNIEKYSTFVFEGVDPEFHARSANNRDKGGHNIVVGGLSYGQGSSREHAAICPMFLGVKAVIAKSFERIHSANLINFGILPLVFKNEADYDKISQSDELELKNIRGIIKSGGKVLLKNITTGNDIELEANLSDRQKEILLAGGMLNVAGN